MSLSNLESSATERIELQLRTENSVLNVSLGAYNEVVAKTKKCVKSEEEKLDQKLEGLWTASLTFLEEMNQFHEHHGVSSPWWNAVELSVQNTGIQNRGSTRRQRQKELDQLKVEVNQLEESVESGREQIRKLKWKAAADEAKILELKRIQEELQQEPFGSEFMRQKFKEARRPVYSSVLFLLRECLQYHSVPKPDSTGLAENLDSNVQIGGLKRQQQAAVEAALTENPGFIKASNIPDQDKPAAAQFTAHKVFKMREMTTLVYRRQAPVPATARSAKNFASDFGHTVTERNPWERNDEEDYEEEITHS